MTVSLRDFLATGQLGDLAVGTSKAEVESFLGRPKDVSVRQTPLIWRYGLLQVAFDRDTVRYIGLYLGYGGDLPPPVQIDGYVPGVGRSSWRTCAARDSTTRRMRCSPMTGLYVWS